VLTRRRFVKLVGTGAALVACGDNIRLARGVFLDERGYETIDIATGIIFPGARDAQAVRYIDTLLAAFDVAPPAIFASGPFSGRTAFPKADDGTPSKDFPSDSFAEYLPLPRIKELAWRIRIFGSAQTAGGDFNDALLGPTVGYRDLYTDGIKRLDAVAMTITAKTPFRLLDPADQGLALDTVASDAPAFYQALLEHTLEGTFGAPEYGGNTLLSGWKLTKYDGDSAPLGHAFYSASLDAYVDRADQPTAQPSPGDVTEDFDDDVLNILTIAALGSGGKRFF